MRFLLNIHSSCRCLLSCLSFALAAPSATFAEPSSQPLIEVVSFGVAPVVALAPPNDVDVKREEVIYRPAPAALASRKETETRALSGESWPALFRRAAEKLGSEIMANADIAGRAALLPPLEPGKYLRFRSVDEGAVLEIDYVVQPEQAYSITLARGALEVRPSAIDPRVAERMRADPTKASLFTATDAIGLPDKIVLELAEIFSDDIDFHRELHHGYRCTLVYEVHYREGHFDGVGRILAAEFTLRNRRLQAYYYNDGHTRNGYYTETGKSMKKAFRKSPVEFSRVTSEYTLARFHPVLGIWRAHRGIDYAAPLGSGVFATADGVVEFVGERGELGNLVILRHYRRFLTYYGHLSRFANNLASGSAVQKGQLIGYVGMTGLATGPHLHYEFRVDDGSGTGLGVPIPPPDVLDEPPLRSAAFFRMVDHYREKFEVAAKTHTVVLD